MSGPLSGVKILEFAGIGPGPFCAMLLSDMGAEVLRIDRKSSGGSGGRAHFDVTRRGRKSLGLDIKNERGVETCLRLAKKADGLLEGYRPGVMERLGLGPESMLGVNPRLVYGRMTGWGQDGPLSHAAGHDINYIALTGVLDAIGTKSGGPVPPLNLTGDFGGGALYLALGMCAGLFEAARSGKGQVVDCAMTDGSASLMAMFYGFAAGGMWSGGRGENLLDGGAHFYGSYETSDGKWIAIGSIEPQFYAILREKMGLSDSGFEEQMNSGRWPELRQKVAAVVKTKTRSEWCALLEGTDACFAPVLSMEEAADHPHNASRKTLVEIDGVVQPNVAPRFSRTPSQIQGPPPRAGEHSRESLAAWGFEKKEIDDLSASGII